MFRTMSSTAVHFRSQEDRQMHIPTNDRASRAVTAVLALALLLGTAVAVRAQEPAPSPTPTPAPGTEAQAKPQEEKASGEKPNFAETITVTANKRTEDVQDVAA